MYSWQLLKHFVSLKISSVDKGLSHRRRNIRKENKLLSKTVRNYPLAT